MKGIKVVPPELVGFLHEQSKKRMINSEALCSHRGWGSILYFLIQYNSISYLDPEHRRTAAGVPAYSCPQSFSLRIS